METFAKFGTFRQIRNYSLHVEILIRYHDQIRNLVKKIQILAKIKKKFFKL